MRFHETTRLIAASPERVWACLTDKAVLTNGRLSILSIDGEIAVGQKISLRSEVDPNRAFKIKVTRMDAPREMIWSGGMPFGLFQGVRSFRLSPEGRGTRFTLREDYVGPLAGRISKMIPDLQPSFETFAAGLADAAEGA